MSETSNHPVHVDLERSDEQNKGQAYLDGFIQKINADHDDVIVVPREIGCFMRNEIERLREEATDALTELNHYKNAATYYNQSAELLAELAEAKLQSLSAVPARERHKRVR